MKRPWVRLLLLAAVLVLAYAVGRATGVTEDLTAEGIRDLMHEAGPAGFFVFLATFVAGQLLYIPGFIFVAIAGLAYGPILGPAAAMLGATISVGVSFVLVRTIGGQPLKDLDHPRFRRLLAGLNERPLRSMILIRLFFWALPPVNYALAMSGVRFADYMLAAVIGCTPPFVVISVASALGVQLL